jgi:hypothetical protein
MSATNPITTSTMPNAFMSPPGRRDSIART